MKREDALPRIEDAVRRVFPETAEEILDTLAMTLADPGNQKPKWLHNCGRCLFIGHFRDMVRTDVYVCDVAEHTLIARWGDNPRVGVSHNTYADVVQVQINRGATPGHLSFRLKRAYELAVARLDS